MVVYPKSIEVRTQPGQYSTAALLIYSTFYVGEVHIFPQTMVKKTSVLYLMLHKSSVSLPSYLQRIPG